MSVDESVTGTSQPNAPDRVSARRAIEALRSGVPNRAAVEILGSSQTAICDRFDALLAACGDVARQEPVGGMLMAGGFGSGKSHLLEYLAERAVSAGFLVSKVVVSKETGLHDPIRVLRAALAEARLPGRVGSAIDEIAAGLRTASPEYAALYRWVHRDDAPVDSRFAATLFVHEYARGDAEFADRIVRFWAGDPLPLPELRRRLKEAGAAGTYRLGPIRERELAVQRFRFVSRLAQAAGYRGWAVLIDEVELIGRYSFLQRAKSYAEINRWIRGDRDDPSAPLVAVMATVDDFEAQVLVGKNDIELIPSRLRAKATAESDLLAGAAESGMRVLERQAMQVQPPGPEALEATYTAVKALHAAAYGWTPPDVAGLERLPSNRMRQYVRAWINEWDLVRADPSFRPETTVSEVTLDYREDAELEGDAEPG